MTRAQCAGSPRCTGAPVRWYRGLCHKHYDAWRTVNRPVDVEIVRDHIARLRAARMGVIRISQLSGVPSRTVGRIANGQRPDQKYVYADRARAILAVNPDTHRPVHMDPTGTSRKLRALVAMGFTQEQILAALPTARPQIQRYLKGTAKGVTPATHDQIDAAFRTLSAQTPPTGQSADRARATAARHGYLPALAWDLETIDDPAAEPLVEAIRRKRRGDVLDGFRVDYLELRDEFGLTDQQIADRLGITGDLLLSRLSRLKIPSQQSNRAAS